MNRIIPGAFAFAAVLTMASLANAQFAGGGFGGGGFGGGGFSGAGIGAGVGAAAVTAGGIPGVSPGSMIVPNPPGASQRFRDLKIAGRIPADPAKLPSGARIVQLRVNGQTVPMALDTEVANSGDLQFDPSYGYGRDLYRSMLSRPVTVVGDEALRNQIMQAASDPKSAPMEVDGYIFDRLSPYFVVRSVAEAP
jgi:hypothetical protein